MKRKWYLGGKIPMYYSIARFGLTFLIAHIARKMLNVEIIGLFEDITGLLGPLTVIASFIAMFVIFKKILKDYEDPEKRFDYNFSRFSLYIFIKCVSDVATAFAWELYLFYLCNEIDSINGIPTCGHPVGALIFSVSGFSVLLWIFSIFVSSRFKRVYQKKIKSLQQ